jgi:hypothetical protein
MKKLLGVFIALFVLGNCLFAGVMEDLNAQLNDIEQEFWAVLASPSDSQYYKEFDARLKKFVFKCQELQFKISQNPFYKHLPNLTSPAITLTRTFSTVNRPSLIKVGHRRFHRKRTNMFSYRTEFSRIEKERISAEVEAQKERGVKNPKRRKPRYPNLANINVRYYTTWINDIKAANISSVVSSYRGSRGRGKGRKPDPSLRILAEKYSSFMSAIADLRIAIVTIRQQVKDIK